MPISKIFIAVVGVAYLGISIHQLLLKNIPMSITYFGYALGNVGLFFLAS